MLVAVDCCCRTASVEDGLEAICLLHLTPISSRRQGLLLAGADSQEQCIAEYISAIRATVRVFATYNH